MAVDRLGKSSSFKATWDGAITAGAGFTLQGQTKNSTNDRFVSHYAQTHTLNDENLTLYSDEAYTGAAAVAPKAGKSSSTSRGFWLFIVFTVKEAEINTLKLADNTPDI